MAFTGDLENLPIVDIIRSKRILSRFPGRTESDLYVWIVKHWDGLKHRYGQDYSIDRAVEDFSKLHGTNMLQIIGRVFVALFRSLFR